MINCNKIPGEFLVGAEKGIGKVSEVIDKMVARELEMVPKYLELATFKGGYRFNASEISEISKLIGKCESKASKTDLIKGLLAIGEKNKNIMTFQEIKDFLLSTEHLNQEGQERVLRFTKAFKESTTISEINFNFVPKKISLKDFISPQQKEFITSGIATCKEPEILEMIVEKTGINPCTTFCSNELVNAYKISGNNIAFPFDLAISFYPHELKQIMRVIESGEVKPNFTQYKQFVTRNFSEFSKSDYTIHHKKMIKDLGLEGKIKLSYKARNHRHQDVYGYDYLMFTRSSAINKGNFERGKKQ